MNIEERNFNETNFTDWLSSKLGKKIGEVLGSGTQGVIFDMGYNVLKISYKPFNEIESILNKNIEGIAKVYAHGSIQVPPQFLKPEDGFGGQRIKVVDVGGNNIKPLKDNKGQLFYLIMEKLYDGSDVAWDLNMIEQSIERYYWKKGEKSIDVFEILKNASSDIDLIRSLYNHVKEDLSQQQADLMIEWSISLKNIAQFFNWRDAHVYQFALNQKGQLVAFDFDNPVDKVSNFTKHMVAESVKPQIKITDEMREFVQKFETDEQLLRSGGFDIDILDRAAFGFSEDDVKTINPRDLKVRWFNDLENVKHEIKHSGLGEAEWAKQVDLSEPIDVDYWEDHKLNFKRGFYIQDGHHRYTAALILSKPLNVNLQIKVNPMGVLAPNMGYDDFHREVFRQVKGGLSEIIREMVQMRMESNKQNQFDSKYFIERIPFLKDFEVQYAPDEFPHQRMPERVQMLYTKTLKDVTISSGEQTLVFPSVTVISEFYYYPHSSPTWDYAFYNIGVDNKISLQDDPNASSLTNKVMQAAMSMQMKNNSSSNEVLVNDGEEISGTKWDEAINDVNRALYQFEEFMNNFGSGLGQINEGYDDVDLEYVKNERPKLSDVSYNKKKEFPNFTLVNIPPTDDFFSGHIFAFDKSDETEIGNSSYTKRPSGLKATIDIRPDWRRKKVATEIYKFIEELMGEKMNPDLPHSDSASKFWDQPNRPFGDLNENEYHNHPEIVAIKNSKNGVDLKGGEVKRIKCDKSKPNKCETNVFHYIYDRIEENLYPVKGYAFENDFPIEHWWVYDADKKIFFDPTPAADSFERYVGIIGFDIKDEIRQAKAPWHEPERGVNPFDVDFFRSGNLKQYLRENYNGHKITL